MSDDADHIDDRALAGEYVLGLMSETDSAAFEARLAEEAELRALVQAWAEDLVRLTDDVDPVEPPRHLQAQIEQRLFGAPERASVLQRLRLWLFGGLVVAGLAAFVIFGTDVLQRGPQMPGDPAYVAQIEAEDQSLVLQAAYDAEAGQLHILRDAGAARPGRALELWLIEGGNAPVSLGVLSDEPHTVLTVATPLQDVLDGAVLAVSDEPPGGSPTGAPTGDVLGVGEVTDA